MRSLIFFLTFFLSFSLKSCIQGQSPKKDSDIIFKEYITLFPVKNLPFITSWNFDIRTPFEVPLAPIPKKLYSEFICSNGINCSSDFCDIKKFFGFDALCQFQLNESFNMLIATNNTDASCDEKWYLITYTPQGKCIDKLWIFGKTYLSKSGKIQQPRIFIQVESKILEKEIFVEVKQTEYIDNEKRKQVYIYNYSIGKD